MDADNSHDPSVLPTMISAMASCDLVIGSRYVSGGSSNQSVLRKINSAIANALARRALDISCRDCTSGFRLYSTNILREIPLADLQSKGYSMLVELLCDVFEANGRVEEVPICFIDRSVGESKIGAHEMWESVRTMARLRRGRFGPLRTQIANALFNIFYRAKSGASSDRKD